MIIQKDIRSNLITDNIEKKKPLRLPRFFGYSGPKKSLEALQSIIQVSLGPLL